MKSNLSQISLKVIWILFLAVFLAACQSGTDLPTSVEESAFETFNEPSLIDDLLAEDNNAEKNSTTDVTLESSQAKSPEPIQEDKVPTTGKASGLGTMQDSLELEASGIQVGFTEDGHAFRGDPNAPIVIKEYSDYQCPFCARFYEQTLPAIEADQIANGNIVLIYYDFPLNNIHPQATAAANAARCAGEYGAAAYWSMHDQLFKNPGSWSNQAAEDVFISIADIIGIDDVAAFQACILSNKYEQEIQADLDSGVTLGVSGTPSFFINGQLLVGAQPLTVFNEAIATISEGGQLASNNPPEPTGPTAAPTPATINQEFAGVMGDPGAPVTIVEFTDYQCPYCARHSTQTMPTIISEMIDSGRVYYVLKDLPLDQIHPDARAAATAARCAGDQDAYWKMHDAIFVNQTNWAGLGSQADELFLGYANDLGLDGDEFSSCLSSGRFDSAIETNVNEARALGIEGTPFFFVDGYPLNGARPTEHFQIAVELAEEGRLAEAFAPPPQAEPPQPSDPVEVLVGDAFAIGDADAPVTIIEFTDFQCPFCSRHYQETYPQIFESYVNEGLVQYVYKDFPLNNIHPQAFLAAQAARCAGDQDAFLDMHDLLFERQGEWGSGRPSQIFAGYSEDLGLNVDQFGDCLDSGKYSDAVNADLQQGIELGVTGTPAFFINGYLLSGAQPFALFEQAIESLIAEQGS